MGCHGLFEVIHCAQRGQQPRQGNAFIVRAAVLVPFRHMLLEKVIVVRISLYILVI